MEDFDNFNEHDADIEEIWKEEISLDEKILKTRELYESKIATLSERKSSLAIEVRSLSGIIAKQNRTLEIAHTEIGRLRVENLQILARSQQDSDRSFDKAVREAREKREAKEQGGMPTG